MGKRSGTNRIKERTRRWTIQNGCLWVVLLVAVCFAWPAFAGGESFAADRNAEWSCYQNNAANNGVVDRAGMPATYEETSMKWSRKMDGGFSTSFTPPLIIDGCLYAASNTHVYGIDKNTGEILKQSAPLKLNVGYAMNPITYDAERDQFYVPILRGRVECLDAETLQSKWISKEYPYTQTLSPISCRDGFVYTGIWETETDDGVFFCLNADTGKTVWSYKPTEHGENVPHGFYWAGAYVDENYVVVGSDDGAANTFAEASEGVYPQTAVVYCFDRRTGNVVDKITGIKGDIRSTVVFDNGHIYFVSKGGRLYKTTLGADGKFSDTSYIQLKERKLKNGTYENGGTDALMTSAPVIYNGRIYVGAAGSGGQFSADGGHMFAVIRDDARLSDGSLIYTVPISGYPQTPPLLSTATESIDGKVRLYFTSNAYPGGIYCLEDSADATATNHEKAHLLFRPEKKLQQYCISPLCCDNEGTIYYKNDSGALMAVEQNKAYLEDISVKSGASGGTELKWDEPFDCGIMNYVLQAPNGTSSVDVRLTVPEGMTATVAGKAYSGTKVSVPLTGEAASIPVVVSRTSGGKAYARTYTLNIGSASNNANLASLVINASNTKTKELVGFDPAFDPGITEYVGRTYGGDKEFLNLWPQTADPEATVRVIPVNNVGNTAPNYYMNDDGTLAPASSGRYPIYWVHGETFAEVDVEVTAPSRKATTTYHVTLMRDESHLDVGKIPMRVSPSSVTLYTSGEEQQASVTVTYNKNDVTDLCSWESTDPQVATVDANGTIVATGEGEAEIWVYYSEINRRARVHVDVILKDPPLPGKTTGLTASVNASKKKAALKYKAAKDADSYRIAYRTAGGKWKYKTASGTSYTLTGLTANACYEIKVSGVNSTGEGGSSNTCLCMISKTTLNLKAGKQSFKETTKKVKGATGYQIRYSLKKDLSGAKTKKTKTTSLTVKKLKKKKVYYVEAVPYKVVSGKTYLGEPVKKSVKTK